MDDDLAVLGQQIDKSQVPPIHQKRILAFVNHFIVSTVTFLNKFVIKCESKFIEFENKLQQVEASLQIVESKLASVPDIQDVVVPSEKKDSAPEEEKTEEVAEAENAEVPEAQKPEEPKEDGVKASEDVRYRKYFKMVQFGVPPPAVKQKMGAEGLNPDILE
uniref:WASH complex subunit 3 n=1 Tax=Phlebotomus papatasi TaxID=29031 RepID=A0A1B0D737_PHLPP